MPGVICRSICVAFVECWSFEKNAAFDDVPATKRDFLVDEDLF